VAKSEKRATLVQLLREEATGRVIVFTRTKHGADKLHRDLDKAGITAAAIHGNKSQNQRERALAAFKSQRPPVLIATDIAARGIDVDQVTHVVNFELPHEPETYVHRIGRTGRAGQTGVAISLCDNEERARLVAIERLLRRPIPQRNAPPAGPIPEPTEPARSQRSAGGPRGPRTGQGRQQRRPQGKRRQEGSRRPGRGDQAPAAATVARKPKKKHRRAL
jgi:ATP-dependent RNA helicase RhlE